MIQRIRRRALVTTALNSYPHGKCGDYAYWKIEDGVLYITGHGSLYSDQTHYSPSFPAPWKEYNGEITEISIASGITRISAYAFYQLTNVTKTTIPDTVTYISQNAYDGCTALSEINFYMKSGEVYYWAFQNCPNRKRINIKSLSDYINVKLDQLGYPSGTDLYLNGQKITNLVLPSGVTRTSTFNHMTIETVYIPNTVTTLTASCFEACSNLHTVTFQSGSTITSIPSWAFRICTALVNINVPDTVEKICGGAFCNDSQLLMTRLPLAITQLLSDQYAPFSGCTSITFTSLPETITNIPQGCFSGCTNVAIATLPTATTVVGSDAFRNTASTINRFPSTVTTVGRACLANNITKVYFDGTPTSVNAYAFENLYQLTDIYVPWASGEVANAPWCSSATIHYNS